jgi:predicted  nucleic acid-binding Zn-ribbon protein
MRETLAQLVKLQGLEITLNEARILHGEGTELSDLEAQIRALRKQTSEDILARYDRLARHGLAVVEVKNGLCLGCCMSIPVGDVNRMRSSKAEASCPHCGRFVII